MSGRKYLRNALILLSFGASEASSVHHFKVWWSLEIKVKLNFHLLKSVILRQTGETWMCTFRNLSTYWESIYHAYTFDIWRKNEWQSKQISGSINRANRNYIVTQLEEAAAISRREDFRKELSTDEEDQYVIATLPVVVTAFKVFRRHT
jgi:hypothetical protein